MRDWILPITPVVAIIYFAIYPQHLHALFIWAGLSTFFRYFPTKEDVVLYDALDPLLLASFRGPPPELTPGPPLELTRAVPVVQHVTLEVTC